MTWFSKNNQKKSRLRSLGFYISLILAVIFAWIFTHDFVVQGLNKKSLNKQALLDEQAYSLQWEFKQSDDVISLFDSIWITDSGGFGFKDKKAEISLNLRGGSVIKPIHQELVITLMGEDEAIKDLRVAIEFADPHSGNYYHSRTIALTSGENWFKLSELKWQAVQQNNGKPTAITWQSMTRLSTLVLRFSNPNEHHIFLKSVTIPQLNPIYEVAASIQLPCDEKIENVKDRNIPSFCWNSNFMAYLHREMALSGQLSQVFFIPIFKISPWVWLLVSLVFTFMIGITHAKAAKKSHILTVVVGVYLLVSTLHWIDVVQWDQIHRWPMFLVALLLLWVYRRVFGAVFLNAWPVWLFTALLSLILYWMGGYSGEFINLLPMYLLWACIQQIMLGPMATDFFHQRLNAAHFAVASLVAFIFALLHMPNHTLMLATFIGGFVWSYSWLKYKNIYVNIISHSLLALLFYQAIPTEWLGSARVGVFF